MANEEETGGRTAPVFEEADVGSCAARLRSILDTAPVSIILIDEHGMIENFSRTAERLFGYRAREVIGRNVKILMPHPYREEHDGYLARYRRTRERHIIGTGRIATARRKDGSVFPIELSVGEVEIDGARLFTGFIRDLTTGQRMEQELRQAQKMEAVGQLTGG
ncbi:MAG: PAS domain S-box protein, partial [Salinarimonas sp.]